MKRLTSIDLTKFVKDFIQLELKITEIKAESNILEMRLDETSRLLKLAQNKEKQLIEEKDGLLETVKGLQHTLQKQCDLRADNEKLKNTVLQMKKENAARMEESNIQIQRLTAKMKAMQDQHQRELEDCHRETQRKLNAKDTELKVAQENNECALEEMRRQMREKEQEKQSQIIKLQMEFGAKLARAQSMSAKSQPQAQASAAHSQTIFKRKLQFTQEEKNKEIEALRHSRLKRRKN